MPIFNIKKAPIQIQLENWKLEGENIVHSVKKLGDLSKVFMDHQAFQQLDPETVVYRVQAYLPVREGTPGGLFFGTTEIMPGKVGNEYFMTRGHFHAQSNRSEFYWGVKGKGMLIFMDEARNTWAEEMNPGSLHYIGGYIAHRVANTGDTPLIFGACWPSDAGHNYEVIDINGFSARLIESEGHPVLIENSKLP
jgi:glucose-6-phosphate isomerase, archaeal